MSGKPERGALRPSFSAVRHFAWVFLCISAVCGLLGPLLAAASDVACAAGTGAAQSDETVAKDARLAGDAERTRFIADLSKKVKVSVFSLDDPYRVIVDLPDVSFQMPPGLGTKPKGLVTGYRYGLYAPGKSRIVIDVSGPFLVDKSFVLDPTPGQPARLVIDLVPTNRATFLAKNKQSKAAIENDDSADAAANADADASLAPADSAPDPNAKPLVVLDPGHGGVDPGTSAPDGTMEKNVVLAFAKLLRKQLEASGRFRVLMTRDDDTYITLPGRVAFARKHKAALFLSIHADSFPNPSTRGATVFTLSDKASDEEAKEVANKENSSDSLAGFPQPKTPDQAVTSILFDLAQRETQNRSIVFASSITSHLEGEVRLHAKAPKSAGFVVLKNPDVPSVLLELGYLSDPADEKLLLSRAWQAKTADAVTRAVESYFDKRVATLPY